MSCVALFVFVSLAWNIAGGFLVPNGKTTVHTPVGDIVGFTTTATVKGSQKSVRNFLGIPYAEPPINSNRFLKPVQKAAFPSPFDASKYGHSCFQFEGLFRANENISFSEDCLSLNIYAPEELPGDVSLYPVMVWIHGGGFTYGMSSEYDAGAISSTGEVIIVTLNYRLNVFGFLSVNETESDGNYGLWDQQLGIKWVHDNIHAFGGDTSRITVFGESAGAASVIYQTLYPGNRGLFQRAIAQSGSATSPWAFTTREKARNQTLRFAAAAGCPVVDSESIKTCLQSKTTQDIKDTMNIDATTFDKWTPVIDGQFILDNPLETLTGQYPVKEVITTFHSVDLIIGVNSKEGLNTFFWEFSNPNFTTSDIDNKFIPRILAESSPVRVTDIVRKTTYLEYKEWTYPHDKYRQFDRFVDLISDLKFYVPSVQTALKHEIASNRTTFVYKLSTAPPMRSIPVDPHVDGPTVANHADDLTFLFDPWVFGDLTIPAEYNVTITKEQRNTGIAMVMMWTNFAKTGDPNQPEDVRQYINTTWLEYEPVHQEYLDISPNMDDNSMKERFSARAFEFWTRLIPSISRVASKND